MHKAIAGRLLGNTTTFLSGKVTYNEKGLEEIQPRRVAAFIGQTDRHLPTLTVRETVEFAYKCSSLFPGEAKKAKKGTEAIKVRSSCILACYRVQNSAAVPLAPFSSSLTRCVMKSLSTVEENFILTTN